MLPDDVNELVAMSDNEMARLAREERIEVVERCIKAAYMALVALDPLAEGEAEKIGAKIIGVSNAALQATGRPLPVWRSIEASPEVDWADKALMMVAFAAVMDYDQQTLEALDERWTRTHPDSPELMTFLDQALTRLER